MNHESLKETMRYYNKIQNASNKLNQKSVWFNSVYDTLVADLALERDNLELHYDQCDLFKSLPFRDTVQSLTFTANSLDYLAESLEQMDLLQD